MEDITQKFMERLKELIALGKKKKSILDCSGVNDFFNDMEAKHGSDGESVRLS